MLLLEIMHKKEKLLLEEGDIIIFYGGVLQYHDKTSLQLRPLF